MLTLLFNLTKFFSLCLCVSLLHFINQVKQVHMIIDELARALEYIEDTIQTNSNVGRSFLEILLIHLFD